MMNKTCYVNLKRSSTVIIFDGNNFLVSIANYDKSSWCNLKKVHKQDAIFVACGPGFERMNLLIENATLSFGRIIVLIKDG